MRSLYIKKLTEAINEKLPIGIYACKLMSYDGTRYFHTGIGCDGFGEPLTDKKIFERIKKIKLSFSDSIIKFYTNLGLADNETIDRIFQSELNEINISFNGYDKKNYENTMKTDYDKTYYNLKKLIEEKNRRKSSLKIRISMALVSSNDGSEKDFLKKWLRSVDSVSINKVHNYGNAIEDRSGNYKINYNKQVYPCKYIWNTIVFGVTGDIYACCLDYEGIYNFGNIKEKNILDVFYSNKFRNFRSIHLKNELNHIKMCEKCYTPYKNGVEWLIDELY